MANTWDFLGLMYPCPGYSDEIIHLFLARNLTPVSNRPPLDEDEDLEVLQMGMKELNEKISDGSEILDGKSITAWSRACKFLKS